MNGTLQVIRGFVRKELAQALRDRVLKILLFGAPVIQLTLFGYAISNEFRNITLAPVYAPGDVAARELAERFYASGWFVPARGGENIDPYELLRSGKADAVLVAPPLGLTRASGRSDGQLQLLINASNASKARAVENYANSIIGEFFAERRQTPAPPPPLSFSVRVLYNPTMRTSYFMVPGVMTMLICLVTIMLTGMSLAREKEMGTLESIIAAPLSNLDIILGKAVPFILLGLADALIVITFGVTVFHVPVRGPLVLMALAAVIFVCCTVSIGILISTFAASQQQAMMGAFLFLFPAFLMSGVMFPVENMPEAIRLFAYLDPLMYFVDILRNIMLKGADPQLVGTDLALLAVITGAIMTAAVRRFHQTLN